MTQCSGEPRAGLELEVVHLQHLYLPDISDQISDFFGLSRTPTVRRSDLRRTNTPSLTCPCGFDRAAAQPELVYSPQLITRPCGCSSARLMPPERTGGEHMELVMILFWFCKGVWTHFNICIYVCIYVIIENEKLSDCVTSWRGRSSAVCVAALLHAPLTPCALQVENLDVSFYCNILILKELKPSTSGWEIKDQTCLGTFWIYNVSNAECLLKKV